MSRDGILSQKFTLHPGSYPCEVTLTSDGLTIRSDATTYSGTNQQDSVCFSDVIGCETEEGQTVSTNGNAACFTVYCYPRGKDRARYTGALKRVRRQVTFACEIHEILKDNVEQAEKWTQGICRMIHRKTTERDGSSFKHGNLLFLINPCSGKQQAVQMFHSVTEPMLKEANVQYSVLVTERRNHALEHMHDLDISRWGGVVIVSGDGLIHEVINGLMKRPDWKEAIRLPIGALPGGTGNAMCSAVNYRAGESYTHDFMLHSTFLLLKNVHQPLDLMSVHLCDGSIIYSFLGLAWAIVSDVSLTSERLRYLGPLRFTFVGVTKILQMKTYRARLSYLPVESHKQTENTSTTEHKSVQHDSCDQRNGEHLHTHMPAMDEPVPDHWITIEEDFIFFTATLISHLYADFAIAPTTDVDDGVITLSMIKHGAATRLQLLNMFTVAGEVEPARRGDHMFEYLQVKAFRLTPLTGGGAMTVDGEQVPDGPIQAAVLPSVANLMT